MFVWKWLFPHHNDSKVQSTQVYEIEKSQSLTETEMEVLLQDFFRKKDLLDGIRILAMESLAQGIPMASLGIYETGLEEYSKEYQRIFQKTAQQLNELSINLDQGSEELNILEQGIQAFKNEWEDYGEKVAERDCRTLEEKASVRYESTFRKGF